MSQTTSSAEDQLIQEAVMTQREDFVERIKHAAERIREELVEETAANIDVFASEVARNRDDDDLYEALLAPDVVLRVQAAVHAELDNLVARVRDER
jgi:hypothetical protein